MAPLKQFKSGPFKSFIQVFSRVLSTMAQYKFLFPGQGSQYVGMTSRFSPPTVETLFSMANGILGYDIRTLCLKGPQDLLDKTLYCQPAVVIASLTAYEHIKISNKKLLSGCVGMAGLSVGELTALIAAQAIPLNQGLELVKLRAQAMQDACLEQHSGMTTVIGLDYQTLDQCCQKTNADIKEPISITNYLFPSGYVVSGTKSALDYLKIRAVQAGAASVKDVQVSGGFHSPLMSSAVPKLEYAIQRMNITMPCVPVYSNVTGQPYSSIREIKELLVQQVVCPVLWEQTIQNMVDTFGEKDFVEIGPGKQLKTMLKRINKTSYKDCMNIEA